MSPPTSAEVSPQMSTNIRTEASPASGQGPSSRQRPSGPALRDILRPHEVNALDARFAEASAEALVEWALDRFGEHLLVASSFGAEDVVLIDIAASISPDVRVFTLDTGRLHQETYDVMDAVRERYGIRLEVMLPDLIDLRALLRSKGPNSMYQSVDDRRECCHIRKVEPLRRALSTADAWVTGLRREQAVTRTRVPKVAIDAMQGGILKLNPLATWTRDEVWSRIRERDIPFNALHERGYPSIGCAPCTRAVEPGEHERAGRWWWESADKKECGLHK